ncbi:MAG: SH3 domain-containing protein [Gemmobacter sp.]|nr:SH3 domain-containing protein [Gemmobacter sp.]
MKILTGLAIAMVLGSLTGPALSESTKAPMPRPAPRAAIDAAIEAANAPPKPTVREGRVTKRPVPRYVSLKTSEGNARRGPGVDHRVDWVFTVPGMPLRITAEHENWRRVEDAEGVGGWIHYTLLSGTRTVLVSEDLAEILSKPDSRSNVVARAELGVIARLQECVVDWCRVLKDGKRGWMRKASLWGVSPDEVFE